MNSVVLVRKGAPNELLIGTDVHSHLGLSILAEDSDGGMTDLFTGQRLNFRQTTSRTNRESPNKETLTKPVPVEKGGPDTSSAEDGTQPPGSSTQPADNEMSCTPVQVQRLEGNSLSDPRVVEVNMDFTHLPTEEQQALKLYTSRLIRWKWSHHPRRRQHSLRTLGCINSARCPLVLSMPPLHSKD